MKVGIMSMQRVVNNGSFLQAYSLKKNIEKLGAEVEFVDYKPGPVLVDSSDKTSSKENSFLHKIADRIVPPVKVPKEKMNEYWDQYKIVDAQYNEKMLPMLGVSSEKKYCTKLDLLVIGSDEVFNCLQPNPDVGYSKHLFGGETQADRVISYAASFGNTKEEGLKKYGIYDEISGLINKFAGLSARDKNTYNILKEMSDLDVIKNVDPVFLYDYNEEIEKIKVPIDNYIVIYAYAGRISKEESKAIIKFAKKHNKKIVCLCAPQTYIEGYLQLNPFEVLAYVKNADFVITDTFHGSVFSIKYNKQFATFIRGGYEGTYGNNEKLFDLLSTFGLESRSVENISSLEEILLKKVNYDEVNTIIDTERKKSINYLSQFVH